MIPLGASKALGHAGDGVAVVEQDDVSSVAILQKSI